MRRYGKYKEGFIYDVGGFVWKLGVVYGYTNKIEIFIRDSSDKQSILG